MLKTLNDSELILALAAFAAGVAGTLSRYVATDTVRKTFARLRRLARLRRMHSYEYGPAESESLHDMGRFGVDFESLHELASRPLRGPRFYVSGLRLQRFRCFEDASVGLVHPWSEERLQYPNVNLILGDNGSGKSTLLRAVAISALAPILDSSGFVPYHLVRKGESQASLTARFLSDDPQKGPRFLASRTELRRVGDYEALRPLSDDGWGALFADDDPSFLIVGYGVHRRVAEDDREHSALDRGRRRRRYQRVASLFDETAVLTPLSSWLPRTGRRRRREIEELFHSLLPAYRDLADDGEAFGDSGLRVPYRALSDGYRNFIGWLSDLLFQIEMTARGDMSFQEIGGIVLVDEVDLLLHPVWQREVVTKIAMAFPNLQFVFTSHSPIVAGTLNEQNILVARKGADGVSRLDRLDLPIHGRNAEQVLLSAYFDLPSTRAPDAQSRLNELAVRAMDGDDHAAMEYLRALAARGSGDGEQ